MTAALLEVPGRAAEVLDSTTRIQRAGRAASPRRATCSISAAAPASRSRWKAR